MINPGDLEGFPQKFRPKWTVPVIGAPQIAVLVVDLPLWTIWKSVGVVIPNIWKKNMFQTTNQCSFEIYGSIMWATLRNIEIHRRLPPIANHLSWVVRCTMGIIYPAWYSWYRVTYSRSWLKRSPNVKHSRPEGNETFSKLWLKRLLKVKFVRSSGKLTWRVVA